MIVWRKEMTRDPEKLKELNWKRKIKIAYEIATALTYIHACRMIHCDIKPSNILVSGRLVSSHYMEDLLMFSLKTAG